jgi:hypothetical protein
MAEPRRETLNFFERLVVSTDRVIGNLIKVVPEAEAVRICFDCTVTRRSPRLQPWVARAARNASHVPEALRLGHKGVRATAPNRRLKSSTSPVLRGCAVVRRVLTHR